MKCVRVDMKETSHPLSSQRERPVAVERSQTGLVLDMIFGRNEDLMTWICVEKAQLMSGVG
jgi:hypothetical protein